MKFNWGTGIMLAIVGFMSFILYYVITMTTNDKYSHDLVSEKYYQKELQYQDEIDAVNNAFLFKEKVEIHKTKKGLKIVFSKDVFSKKIKGKIFLYRPSNKQLDFEIPFSLSNLYLLVPENRLAEGRWNIEISWKHENTNYLIKEKINY